MTLLQAHRGVSSECPENTMPAFLWAIRQGYAAIETDPMVTKDLQVVLHHDETINRTARHADGSKISAPVTVAETDYADLLAYDFGIWKHPKFAGTKLPLLKELLPIARQAGVKLKLDAKILKMSQVHQQVLFDLIDSWQDICELSTKTVEQTLQLHARFPEIQLHYGGPCEEDKLATLSESVGKDKLNIWLPYPNLRTAYAYANLPGIKPGIAQVPPLTAERARMAAKYGRVCVWNLADEKEYTQAKIMGIALAETNGEVKPIANRGVLSDMHTHSDHSHDARFPLPQIYGGCRSHGIKIMAIADHYDGMLCADGPYDYSHIVESCAEANSLTARYSGDGMVLRGIELGEGNWDREATQRVLSACDYDVVVGAIHAVRTPLMEGTTLLKRAYSQLKYDQLTPVQIYELLNAYFDEVLDMVRTVDIDIAAHLTCVVGYFLNRHNIYVGVEQFKEKIIAILQTMIQKGIALEVNFSVYPKRGISSPHHWIIEEYRKLGGYLICMATDAHHPAECGGGYEQGIEILKELGFKHIFYYKDRIPVQCTLL